MQQISKGGVENTTIRLYQTVDTVLLNSKTADSVEYGLKSIFSKYGIDMFKSITSDNGLEFSTISDVAKNICEVYFAHPYSA